MLSARAAPSDTMKKTAEYLKHARECRTMAQSARNAAERGQLLKMAEAWEKFAIERERGLHGEN
jgi:hypothetical protein